MPSPVVLVVTHTHWDREWYHSAERFRQRLVPLIDELLDEPPAAGSSFLLDGQAALLDDYLAVRPDRAAELSALLRDGRLEAGPWYVLADELIPSGEALVRNLLAGRATLRRLRAEPPSVLYCPDSFGHPATLPELARGFGCALVVLWRGYGGSRWPAGDTARWRGPSGASVILHHLPPDGYEFGSSLPTARADSLARWARIAETMLPRARTGVGLLLNGADHHARQRESAAAIAMLGAVAEDATVVSSTLRDAATAIARAASAVELPEVAGELRDSYGYTWTLGGTLGSRAAQKRRSAITERSLGRDVEPWIALAPRAGDAATRALLGAAWRDLLLAHPHDTLCGTSIDAVARAFDERLARVASQVDGLRDDALTVLVEHEREGARLRPADWRPAVQLRNPVARTRRGVADVTLTTKIADVAVGPGSGSRQGTPDELVADRFEAMGVQPMTVGRRVELTESPRAYPDADLVEEVRGLVWVESIDGYVVETRLLDRPFDRPGVPQVEVGSDSIDNGLLRVEVGPDGAVRLDDRATGRDVDGAVSFEVRHDVGDLYTPAIRAPIDPPRFEGCEPTLRGPLRGELTLHFADPDHGATIDLRLQLDAALPALRILVDGTNTLDDARLRLIVATGAGAAARTIADAAFHPLERRPLTASDADAAMEHVVPTAPLHRFVSRYGTRGGATLVSDGLAEYEALDDGAIAVTLVRAVGALSRHDLPERPGHAGWPAPTPEAQSHGPYAARFALALHGEDSPRQRERIEQLAEDVLLPIVGTTLRSNLGGPRVDGGLTLEGDGLAFSAAMPAQQPGWLVLRCVNRRAEAVTGRWRFRREVAEARRARLDETPGEALTVQGQGIDFVADPMEIVTILARLR